MHNSNLYRLKWLDIAKGIAIILMVLGHTSIPDICSRFIFAFHMPLFFIASGWTTHWETRKFGVFIMRKSQSIMVPFIGYSVVVLILQIVTGSGNLFGWIKYGWQGYALWFVPVLYIASIICRLIYSIKYCQIRYFVVIGLLLLGVLLKYHNLYLPWSLSSVPLACFFVFFGTEFRRYQKLIDIPSLWLFIGCLVVTSMVSYFWKLDMAWNNILPIIPLVIGAIAGTIMVFCLSSYIGRHVRLATKVLSKIGKETFVVVAFSQEIIILLKQYTSFHSIVCYLILIVSLIAIVMVKNKLKT